MPLELGSVLSIEREPVVDPDIRVQALEAIYLISLQVKQVASCSDPCSYVLLIDNQIQ